MLISILQFGGRAPQIIDPALLPVNKSQQAINCRFDRGGLTAIANDLFVAEQVKSGLLKTIYRYKDGNFLTWLTDVDVCESPNPGDEYGRIYYTENGEFKVTDKYLYKDGGNQYPMKWRNPCPPAPVNAPVVLDNTPAPSAVTNLLISSASCTEADGTYNLLFSGGSGSGAAGTYVVANHIITDVLLVAGGSYTGNPTVQTQSGTGVIVATGVEDQTLMETRGYLYTFVNGYGAEGPPSPVSDLIDVFDGDTIAISGMDSTSPDTSLQKYNIVSKRIYRINQSSTGAVYQFVDEIDLATSSYDDTILDSGLGETLQTLEWDAPPLGLQGLISLPNGSLCGFVGNLLCFSVPYYPHAWPVSYQKTTDYPIVGLGTFGTTVAVLTSGTPYLAVGNDPSNVVMEDMETGLASMCKRGVVQALGVVVYPSPEGLAVIGPGVSEILTEGVLTRQEWAALYNPESINAYFWQGKYIGFYKNNAGVQAGFMFDIKTKDLSDLPFYVAAGFRDPDTGTLYLSFGE
jgi:hypothetical protein